MSDVVAQNYLQVIDRIAKAARESGRQPDEISLVSVSKTVDYDRMLSAYNSGARVFGENRPQELKRKYDDFTDCSWHMIGQLQTNKVKYIVGKTAMVHSVDRQNLIDELAKRYTAANTVIDVLLQVNIGAEPQKSGIKPEQINMFADSILKSDALNLRGLMCIPPICKTGDEARVYFANMRKLYDALKSEYNGIDTLSMGMSADYYEAILEGATMVRVGSSIFGRR